MKLHSSFVFLGSIFIILSLFRMIDLEIESYLFGSEYSEQRDADAYVLDTFISRNKNILSKIDTPAKAKKRGLFWVDDIEGRGFGIDLFHSVSLINSLFPGYGKEIHQDKNFQYNYLHSGFGTNSFVESDLSISPLGFRVNYSWTGCFKIYQNFGADVIVFGSSEVYMSLIPKQLSKGLSSVFSKNTKILFCATPAMSTENIKQSVQQLIRLSDRAPKAIIWGYSYWNAYTDSPKLAVYKKERNKEIREFLSQGVIRDRQWHYFLNLKASDFFPAISWDQVFNLSLDKIRLNKGNPSARSTIFDKQYYGKVAEGIYISKKVFMKDDEELSKYLNSNLKPYYAINNSITEKDCALTKAEDILDSTINEMKALSPNIYIYFAPTTLHHRRTVPICFLPNVKSMLARVSTNNNINLLSLEPEEYGLTDRDFVYPNLDSALFYFDINHPNYVGGKKITKRIASWLSENIKKN